MNRGLPAIPRIVAIVAFVAIMAGVALLARQLAYEWLPREIAAMLGAALIAFFGGYLLGSRHRPSIGRGDGAPTSRGEGQINTSLDGQRTIPPRDRLSD